MVSQEEVKPGCVFLWATFILGFIFVCASLSGLMLWFPPTHCPEGAEALSETKCLSVNNTVVRREDGAINYALWIPVFVVSMLLLLAACVGLCVGQCVASNRAKSRNQIAPEQEPVRHAANPQVDL